MYIYIHTQTHTHIYNFNFTIVSTFHILSETNEHFFIGPQSNIGESLLWSYRAESLQDAGITWKDLSKEIAIKIQASVKTLGVSLATISTRVSEMAEFLGNGQRIQ